MRNDIPSRLTGLVGANRMRLLAVLINHELLITFSIMFGGRIDLEALEIALKELIALLSAQFRCHRIVQITKFALLYRHRTFTHPGDHIKCPEICLGNRYADAGRADESSTCIR